EMPAVSAPAALGVPLIQVLRLIEPVCRSGKLQAADLVEFNPRMQDGAASKSYGLAVAALAGVPKEVIKRARQKLRELESISPNAA
ncbi:arginase family protein, partial [Salmonella enterica subsp. enterica serovar Kentucky]|nr:arginase family protein [Salmonella enterica subsp. enterica serovar Kentucky]